MQFLRAEFQLITPIVHNTHFISGHYFNRYFNNNTNALGVIVDQVKWDHAEKQNFFAPYTLSARFHLEYYNMLSRVEPASSLFFRYRKIYTLDNILIVDILNPTPNQIEEFKGVITSIREFQVGGKESDGNGICHYKFATLYDYQCPYPSLPEFILEFMSDYIPRKVISGQALANLIQSRIPQPLPPDYQLTIKSLPDFEKKKYYLKNGMEFQAIPQFFMLHFHTNYPEYNKAIAEGGLRGMGQFRSAGFGKFRLCDPQISPLYHHGKYSPQVTDFSEEEMQFLKAALLHDLIPKVGGIEFLNDYYETTHNLSTLLLKLHYEWHELRQTTIIRLNEFLRKIEAEYGSKIAAYYYKLALADQLAASMTRIKRVPTFSRYVIGHKFTEKVDLLGLTQSLLPLESPFKLWKFILKSPELAQLNESLAYGDQPLSTHLLLTLNFGSHLIRHKTAYVVVKLVPNDEKKFVQGFWYNIFNITQNEEVFIYVIEEKIPAYPAASVKKLLVKSIRPETSWLRIQ
jgi:hypothetical protein